MDIKITHSLLTDYLKTKATPQSIAEKLSLCGPTVDQLEKIDSDWLYHIEVITNRVDAASAFGIAREAYAILPQFGIESSLVRDPYSHSLSQLGKLPANLPANVQIKDPRLVPRFTCIAISGVAIKPSPKEVVTSLEQCGERSLNNIIDISNELTLRYGQPVHIFDLDRIKKQTLIVRESKPKETIKTLDGKTHILPGGDIVIEDGEGRLIDLCGIMGGDLSSVTESTKNVLLFVQTYDAKHIRKTSLATQERTLAAQLFEKQPDPQLVLPVLIEGTQLILDRAGGNISSGLLDIYPHPPKQTSVTLDLNWLKKFTGIDIPQNTIVHILTRLGFDCSLKNSQLTAVVPSWRRHDITIPEDIAEEITRIYGYFRLPSVIPVTEIPTIGTDPALTLEQTTKKFVAAMGFTEIYNYSLVSQELLSRSGLKTETLFKLQNPLSEEYEYMRSSLLPSLLSNLENNRGTITPPIRIFELSHIYRQAEGESLADEIATLSWASVGVGFREAKGYLESLMEHLHLDWEIQPTKQPIAPFAVDKSGILITKAGKTIGHFGQVDPAVAAAFRLPPDTYLFESDFRAVSQTASIIHRFVPISPYPPIIEDLTFTLNEKYPVAGIMTHMKSIDPKIAAIQLKAVYNANFTFTVTYRSFEGNLTGKDIAPIRSKIVETMQSKFKAKLVGELPKKEV